MEFRILGPLEVLDRNGRSLALGGAKQRATLAMLLLGRNEIVSRERLIEGLWGESPPPSAVTTLKTYVSRLRTVISDDDGGARVSTEQPGYRLLVKEGELDLDRYERLLDRARAARSTGRGGSAREDLGEALSLFRGTPLEDLAYAPFAQSEIGRLEESKLGTLELRLDADLELGRHGDVVAELESLVARFPFRESFWGQLLRALYGSGRQGEALLAFDRARRLLADELGVDPGRPLQQVHRRILEQDPSLDPVPAGSVSVARSSEPLAGARSLAPTDPPAVVIPSSRIAVTSGPPHSTSAGRDLRHRAVPRALLAWVASALVLTLVAILLPRALEGEGVGTTAYRPGTVLIDTTTGAEIRSIGPTELAVSAYPIYAGGRFWVNNWSPNAYVAIDPRTGAISKQISPPSRDPDIRADFETVTPFAVEDDVLWVTSADDLVKMDVYLGKETDRFRLDDLGEGSGLAEGVAVGAGSVWVSRDVEGGQILRLDPVTGEAEHVWNDVRPYLNLAFGDGSLWIADERGIARIDPATNRLTGVDGIQGNCPGSGGCVAAGGSAGWTSDGTKGIVYKVDRTGHIAATYAIGIGAGFLSYADGVMWMSNYDEGTVTGIDAATGKTTTTYRFGHPIATMSAAPGVLLVYLGAGTPIEEHIDSLSGTVARFFAHPGQLADEEPALNTDPGAYQIEFATCAKLLNYPDAPPPEGLRLRPEIATSMPTISPDGRTYTFTVRPDYRFSPPSGEYVTAETFRYSIERALSPALAEGPTVRDPPGPHVIDDIEGEQAFLDGHADHISGIRATGDTLSITLTTPSPDFLERLALPFFCPVPLGTPFVAGAPHQVRSNGEGYIVAAGPYYVADYADGYVILKRNPHYPGPRPHAFDAIAIREGGDASVALASTEHEGWDGIMSMFDPALDPGGLIDRRWGAGADTSDGQRYFLTPEPSTRFIAFNQRNGLFSDARVRRAAALALGRAALASTWAQLPTDQLLSPALRGYRGNRLALLSPSIGRARALMGGRTGAAAMPVARGCGPCVEGALLIQRDLAAIGIDVMIRKVDDVGRAAISEGSFDLVDTSAGILYPDPASFLVQMFRAIPRSWVTADVSRGVEELSLLTGEDRQAAAVSLADELATRSVPVAAYAVPQTSQFLGPSIGCRVFTSFGYGVDLAALCHVRAQA